MIGPIFCAAIGAAIVGVIWWISRRSVSGVASDLADLKNDVKKV